MCSCCSTDLIEGCLCCLARECLKGRATQDSARPSRVSTNGTYAVNTRLPATHCVHVSVSLGSSSPDLEGLPKHQPKSLTHFHVSLSSVSISFQFCPTTLESRCLVLWPVRFSPFWVRVSEKEVYPPNQPPSQLRFWPHYSQSSSKAETLDHTLLSLSSFVFILF